MRIRIINTLQSFGLFYDSKIESAFDYKASDYQVNSRSSGDRINEHKEHLKYLLTKEDERLVNIENKSTQIVSQTGIIFALLSLFFPFLFDFIEDFTIWSKVILIIFFLLAFICYLLTINNALKNFKVNKYKYQVPDPGDVIKFKQRNIREFNAELVRDYLSCINNNVSINNLKASNLIHSHNSFKLGNIMLSLLVFSVCFAFFFKGHNPDEIKISDPVMIQSKDTFSFQSTHPITDTFYIRDTLIVRDTIFIRKRKNG